MHEKNNLKNELVQNEIQPLSLAKVTRIALRGIKIRIWRSLLVVSGIVLATAFLSYIICTDTFARNVLDYGSRELIRSLAREGLIDSESAINQRIQTYWVVGLALMISLAGIMNAMLMSVTERFREIGTMKCLGALDSFVLRLFLLESLFEGAIGTTVGIIIGFILAYGEGFASYGREAGSLIPPSQLIVMIAFCFFTGLILSLLGALYPARLASKMEPVMALRSEV